jgi:hypothetical protein
VISEVIRVSMNVAELAMIVGFSFVVGCVTGWWIRGR